MNPEDLHGIIIVDIGDAYVKVAVYYLAGWHCNHWDKSIIIPNNVSSIFPQEIRRKKFQVNFFIDHPYFSKEEQKSPVTSSLNLSDIGESKVPIELSLIQEEYEHLLVVLQDKFGITGPPLKKLRRFTNLFEVLYLWSVYEYLCQKASEKLAINEKIEGWGLDAAFERRYWAILTSVQYMSLKRDQKRIQEMNRWITKQLGFSYLAVRERSVLSIMAHFPKLQQKLPCPALFVDVGGEFLVSSALKLSENPVSSIRFFKPSVIQQTTHNGTAAGKKIEKRYMEIVNDHFEELFPNLEDDFRQYLFKGGCSIRCHFSGSSSVKMGKNSHSLTIRVGDFEYPLPERAKWVPTLIFEPENYELMEYNSLQQIIGKTIKAGEIAGYTAESLLNTVIITGGVANYPGFEDRLKEELEARYAVSSIEFFSTEDPQFGVIEGAKYLVEAFLPRSSFKRLFNFLKPRWV
ncbi:MAG: hypothetical protein ACFFCQ_12650 [Promethearchaeota archaeon]